MKLKCVEGGTPHPEGIFPAVCVDVIDMGMRRTEFAGEEKWVHKVRIVWETQEGEVRFMSRSFTASLHPKARLADMLGKWRGKAVVPGDEIDLDNVIGVSATLVVSHQQKRDGSGTYAAIDAVSRATKKMSPSGTYNGQEERERIRMNDEKRGAGTVGSPRTAMPVAVCEAGGPAGGPVTMEEEEVAF